MQEIQLGRVYRHFKGDYYLVEAVAHDSETGAPCVIYRKLYGDGGLWVPPVHVSEQGRSGKIPGRAAGIPLRIAGYSERRRSLKG